MDYNNGSYKWNYQGSKQNKIGMYKYPVSNTLYRGIVPVREDKIE
jgi:hypothetical protein